MIPKKLRLPKEEFPWKGKTIFSSDFLSIRFKKNDLGVNRIACVAKLKSMGSAAKRNNIRRKILCRAEKIRNVSGDLLFLLRKRMSKPVLTGQFDKINKELEK